jgi:transposase InsO family protein
MFGIGKKKEDPNLNTAASGRRRRGKAKRSRRHAGPYTPEQRRQAVEAYFKSGMTHRDFARTWGTSEGSLYNWVKAYEERGAKALDGASLRRDAKKRGRKGLSTAVKNEILAVKQANPESGNKGIRNLLWRFRGVKVSPNSVGKTLREADIPPVSRRKHRRRRPRKPKVQRFERARPMQLWQTDITSYVLARHSQRVYLTVFMDDFSRYVVSWSLALQQTKEFVMETLLEGIHRFGKPEEVLTDQGRQYFSWRGKSDFRKLLKKQGIQHVLARAHHPQTVGKCERFWETVGEEFWDRVEPQELSDVRERFAQFVMHYNHFRPHQGIDGLVPADRFFGAAPEVRKAIEETISKNALKLALGEAPRQPVYLIGQIGDTPISLHGEKGKLVLQTPEIKKSVDYEDFGHAKATLANSGPTTKPQTHEGENAYDESRDEGNQGEQGSGRVLTKGSEQAAAQAAAEQEVLTTENPGTSGESALGNGLARAAGEGARTGDRDHGILAGADNEAGARSSPQHDARQDLAALAAGDLRDGRGASHPTEGTSPARNEGQGVGTHGAGQPRERSQEPPEEDRGAREEDSHAGETDLDPQGDARLVKGCENDRTNAVSNAGVSEGDGSGCNNSSSSSSGQDGQESGGSNTTGSTS